MKKIGAVLIGMVLMMVTFQSAWAQKEKYHSIFIYTFCKYVKWPENHSSAKFVIGVFGNSKIQKDLISMAATKKINGMPIEVRKISSTTEIGDCNILYVANSESDKMDQITSVTGNQSVLIVTDKPGLAQKGAMINFVEIDGKIKFELNQQNAESHGLKVAGSLVSLAILV